ncbi:alanine racemase [Acuticoccus sp.]|uniref:alanine racemase n=1 Tax=Acuticoccus sp. TaxID=1904378 RepID=UPI003B51F84B
MTDVLALPTPALILDPERLEANAARMLAHCDVRGVTLRPHLKTPKSVDVARIATGGRMSTVTVSTLAEARHFAGAGFDDILYAVGITPNKFAEVAVIGEATGKTIVLTLDSVEMAAAVADSALNNPVLVEVDCGEHRGGRPADDEAMTEIARRLGTQCTGVMTHAGHSYATADTDEVARIAAGEVAAAVRAAERMGAAGAEVSIVSVGSTPTVLHAPSLDGVSEVRAGIHLFFDLSQYGRNVCALDDIAVTVLATVIGHNRAAGVLTLDAGALALSKDVGANAHLPSAGYGWVCDARTLEPLGLSVDVVHQEHGTVRVADPATYERLPIGTVVRVLPGHACLTAAGGYGRYHLTDGRVWDRIDGW